MSVEKKHAEAIAILTDAMERGGMHPDLGNAAIDVLATSDTFIAGLVKRLAGDREERRSLHAELTLLRTEVDMLRGKLADLGGVS